MQPIFYNNPVYILSIYRPSPLLYTVINLDLIISIPVCSTVARME